MIEDEIYTPWKIERRTSDKPVAGLTCRVYDDNGNPMAYAEDDFFMTTMVKRVNGYDDLAARLETTTRERDALLAACETAYAIATGLMTAQVADSHTAWIAVIGIRERLGTALAHEPHGDAGGTPALNRLVEICQEVLMFIRADDSLLLTDKPWRARYAERIRAVLDALESESHDDWKANEGYERLRAERDALLAACERGMEALLEAWSFDGLTARDARIYAALRTGIALVKAGRDG